MFSPLRSSALWRITFYLAWLHSFCDGTAQIGALFWDVSPGSLGQRRGCEKHSCGLQHQPRAMGEAQPAVLMPWLKMCIGMGKYSREEPRFLIKIIWMLGRSERLPDLSRSRLPDIQTSLVLELVLQKLHVLDNLLWRSNMGPAGLVS